MASPMGSSDLHHLRLTWAISGIDPHFVDQDGFISRAGVVNTTFDNALIFYGKPDGLFRSAPPAADVGDQRHRSALRRSGWVHLAGGRRQHDVRQCADLLWQARWALPICTTCG